MNRTNDTRNLLLVLLVISLGFFLLHAGQLDRRLPGEIVTSEGKFDLAACYLDFFPNALHAFFFVCLFLLVHAFLSKRVPGFDSVLLSAVALLAGVGSIVILRLAPDLAIARNDAIQGILARNPGAQVTRNVATLAQLGLKHFSSVVLGGLFLILPSCFGRRGISGLSSRKYIWVLLSVILTVLTLLFGTRINGRRLWFFGFQTVELVKLLMVLFMAGYIYERGKGIAVYAGGNFRMWAQYAVPFSLMCFFCLVPLVVQGDLGPTVLLFCVFLVMFHYAGNPRSVTALFILLLGIAGYVSYAAGWPAVVRQRIDILLDPFGRSESMSRVLWAISSGGILGSGIGYGQSYRIPEVQSDFSFAVVCEEMGFIGAAAILLSYAVLLARCFKVAARLESAYDKALVTGIAALIGIQSFMIVCGNLGGLPLTGITLPFVSHGGSSLAVYFFMIGIVIRLSGKTGGGNEA